MARKAAPKANAKAKSTAKNRGPEPPTTPAKPASETLLDQTEEQCVAKSAKRPTPTRKRSETQIIEKKLADNFKGWHINALHCVIVDDLDLYARLVKDTNDGVMMGKLYYADLRELYLAEKSERSALVPKNEDDVPDEFLDEALTAYHKPPPEARLHRGLLRGRHIAEPVVLHRGAPFVDGHPGRLRLEADRNGRRRPALGEAGQGPCRVHGGGRCSEEDV